MNERDTEMAHRRLRRMGAKWDAERGVWLIPATKRRSLARLLRDLGATPRYRDEHEER